MNENRTLERWFFYQDAASMWRWARLDVLGTVLGCSAAAFEAHEASVEDARRLGYREGPTAPEGFASLRLGGEDPRDRASTHPL
jgi:hypothetical protein